jgi:hypothetical protein
LVEMWTSAATVEISMEISMEVPQETK